MVGAVSVVGAVTPPVTTFPHSDRYMGDVRFGKTLQHSAHAVTAKATQTLVASITKEMVNLRKISFDPQPLSDHKWEKLDKSLANAETYIADLVDLALWGVEKTGGLTGYFNFLNQ